MVEFFGNDSTLSPDSSGKDIHSNNDSTGHKLLNDLREMQHDRTDSTNSSKVAADKSLNSIGFPNSVDLLKYFTLTDYKPDKPPADSDTGDPSKLGDGLGLISKLADVIKANDKSSIRVKPDGSMIKTNNLGQVTEIDYPNGQSRTVSYNPVGMVKALKGSDGSIWSRADEDKSFKLENGCVGSTLTANDILVNADGKVTIINEQLSLQTFFTPSPVSKTIGITTYNIDGSSFVQNPDGQVIKIDYPNGLSRAFQRNDAGEIKSILETDGSTWKLADNGKWYQFKYDVATGQANYDEPDVTSDGKYSFKSADGAVHSYNADGKSEVKHADGSVLKIDSSGQLSEITYTSSDARKFWHDQSGKLTKLENPDGSSWTKDNDQWKHLDSHGKELETASFVPRVFADGSFSVAEGDGTIYTAYPNGTSAAKRGDGSLVSYNTHGLVQSVSYFDGSKRTFAYHNDELTGVTGPDGQTWTFRDNGWQLPDGSPTNQKISVSGIGDLIVTSADAKTSKYLTNGSQVTTDFKDRVIKVQNANGAQREFQRDADGKITSITETDGHRWNLELDGNWHEYDAAGKSTEKTNLATPEVDAQGNYKISNHDGSWELRKSDGSTVQSTRSDGSVTEIDYADGRKRIFKYGQKNEITAMEDGDDISYKDSEGNWMQVNKHTPSLVHVVPAIIAVYRDGSIYSYDGSQILTSTRNVTAHPNPGHNLWGDHSYNPLAAIIPDAVHQGSLGDCYFLAALASMANADPQAVKNMIQENDNGTYTVTFPSDPTHPVTVDCPTEHELKAYAHDDGTNGMWVNVIEKAHRKYTGRETDDPGEISALAGVRLLSKNGQDAASDGFASFCGFGKRSESEVEQDVKNALANNQIIVAQTKDSGFFNHLGTANDPGTLTTDHFFAVIGYNPATRMVTMRNPWGGKGQEGTFEIGFDQFYGQFSEMGFSKR